MRRVVEQVGSLFRQCVDTGVGSDLAGIESVVLSTCAGAGYQCTQQEMQIGGCPVSVDLLMVDVAKVGRPFGLVLRGVGVELDGSGS